MKKQTERYRVFDSELRALLDDPEERKSWLFLEPHSDFEGHWQVNGFSQAFFFDLRELIGPYKAISPANLDEFLTQCEELDYQVAFLDDPLAILDPYKHLNDEPEIEISSSLEGTVNGLLPFQVQGYNRLKEGSAGVALWSTGTGKTVLAAALLLHSHLVAPTRLTFFVVKAHNKVNTARNLKALTGLDSIVIDGNKDRRRKLYGEVQNVLGLFEAPVDGAPVIILNYEKFRTDKDYLKSLIEGQDIFILWDEMPARLTTRTSQVYKGVVECLYETTPPAVNWEKRRAKRMQQIMLTATPIENDPEDFFNCVRIMDPRIFGTVAEFHDLYVATYSHFDDYKPDRWHNLDRMNLQASHIVHLVDKDDPDIAAQFPAVVEETYYVDWDAKNRRIYDLLIKKADKLGLEETNVLAMITVLQMLCDAPTMVANSAAIREAYEQALDAWVEAGGKEPQIQGSEAAQTLVEALGAKNLGDDQHGKIDTLRELVCETHPNEKIVIFSSFNEGLLPILEMKLKHWGVSYVRYDGTDKQKQVAQDTFMNDSSIRVFLSSDQGADSLSLEVASVVIHYDLPWKWSTYTQRQNRIHRVVSKFNKVRFYTLLMADSIEDRKLEIIGRKQDYHKKIFGGAVVTQAQTAKLTKEDLQYILRG